ncbi:MAG: serine hydrolase [bacterium]|nr:serine hydrolase [bacterium]
MKVIIPLLLFTLLLGGPVQASSQEERLRILQRIEILKREIAVVKSLWVNMRLRQEISASSYIAVSLDDGAVLLEKDGSRQLPIASVTKLMGAVIVAEYIDMEKSIVVTSEMLKPLGSSPTIFSGLTIQAAHLLRASLIQSANDASEVLSFFLEKEAFVNFMNAKATELHMGATVFHDPHGLSLQNQSSAADLAKLLQYIYENHPTLLAITRENDFWLPDKTGKLLKFQNVNNFYHLKNFKGGKTGYTLAAKQTLASIFEVNKKPVAIVLLSSSNRQADVFAILRKLQRTAE